MNFNYTACLLQGLWSGAHSFCSEAEETLASRTKAQAGSALPYPALYISVITMVSSGLSVGWRLPCHVVSFALRSWAAWTRATNTAERQFLGLPTSLVFGRVGALSPGPGFGKCWPFLCFIASKMPSIIGCHKEEGTLPAKPHHCTLTAVP